MKIFERLDTNFPSQKILSKDYNYKCNILFEIQKILNNLGMNFISKINMPIHHIPSHQYKNTAFLMRLLTSVRPLSWNEE